MRCVHLMRHGMLCSALNLTHKQNTMPCTRAPLPLHHQHLTLCACLHVLNAYTYLQHPPTPSHSPPPPTCPPAGSGAGKTNVAVLCILHELGLHRKPDGSIDTSAFKIVYVAPMKALVAEMVGNFSTRLGEAYGLKVRELTGEEGGGWERQGGDVVSWRESDGWDWFLCLSLCWGGVGTGRNT